MFWHWSAKCCMGGVEIVAAKQIVVDHKLRKVLQVRFVRLEFVLENCALLEQVGQACHDHGVEHVDLEKELIANMVPIKWYAFDECNSGYKSGIEALLISAKADS